MMEFAHEVWQFKKYLADKYRRNFDMDSTYVRSIQYALTALSAGEHNKLMPQGIVSYCRQLSNIYEELESRDSGNAPQPVFMAIDYNTESDSYDSLQHDDLIDLEELDRICPLGMTE